MATDQMTSATTEASATSETGTATDPVLGTDNDTAAQINKHGFPAETPLAEMATEQQLAYWKHQSRRHEDASKALRGGVTADDAQKLKDRIAELERERLSEGERAHADAIEAARAEAAQQAREELLPKLREAELRGYASIVLTDQKKLNGWLRTTNADAFLSENGELNGEKVVDHLREMYGTTAAAPTPPPNGQRHPNWGQGQGGETKTRRGESGRAEAARRFGTPKE
ncbi:hypothetical protein [Nocardia terpenica]|uniref:Scaffolding protein n=1 Tax=Nocardia terpenica TaxID=455432 RepID=A0A164K5Y0_9NOCA|nr:hypothetical protein [Nocardia terpenica]KZM71069.1 hypothetical protein AWN90_41880 [Nocardia terpenica]NQE89610.1 hypothetical protein [Nocardia terpenica]